MSYGDRWRTRHRLSHEVLNERLAGSFDDHQYKYTYRLLSRLLEAPESFFQEAELYVAFITLHPSRTLTDPLILEAPPAPLYYP